MKTILAALAVLMFAAPADAAEMRPFARGSWQTLMQASANKPTVCSGVPVPPLAVKQATRADEHVCSGIGGVRRVLVELAGKFGVFQQGNGVILAVKLQF